MDFQISGLNVVGNLFQMLGAATTEKACLTSSSEIDDPSWD